MSNTILYDANKHGVDAVTVFQSNRAEIRRKIAVDLKDGQNAVEVKNLPSCLDLDSIRVDGIGDAVILDVIYHPPLYSGPSKRVEAVDALHRRSASLQAELSILDRQAAILQEYSKTLTGKDMTAAQLEAFLETYASRQRKIDEAATEVRSAQTRLTKEIYDATVSANTDEESIRLRGARVTIVVLGAGAGAAELTLTYVVSCAQWTPQYDLRAAIPQDQKAPATVALHYRASISQTTGEDWADVALTLSTAAPLRGTAVPVLQPHWIGKRAELSQSVTAYPLGRRAAPAPVPVLAKMVSDSEPEGEVFFKSRARHQAARVDEFAVPPPPPLPPGFFGARDSSATEGAVSTTFTIPGRSSIPSDTVDSFQTHKVSIAEIEFGAVELEWLAVPKDVLSVFLQCKVKNTSAYVLLAGQANVFMNNNFVAKSTVPHVSPQESFSCSLGVDPAVRVTYHPQSKKTRTAGGYLLGARTSTTAFEQAITVKNTRGAPLRRLLVRDQVPVSRETAVRVAVLEPRDLLARGAPAKGGVYARWVQRNADAAGAPDAGDEGLGLLEWVCEIGAGASVDLNLAWEVTAPAGVGWVKQY